MIQEEEKDECCEWDDWNDEEVEFEFDEPDSKNKSYTLNSNKFYAMIDSDDIIGK